MDKVGYRIKMRRLELGMTQSELAKKMGYTSKTAISKVERTDEDMSMARVKKFATALECTPGFLMGWEEQKVFQVPSDYFIDSRIYGEEKAAIIELVKSMDDKQISKLEQLLALMYPELKGDF